MNDPQKVYETQKEIQEACSSGDADFKRAIFKCDAKFSLLPFNGKADFSGAVFKGHADFTNFEFRDKVDFTGAVFEDGASFENAEFLTQGQDVLFDDAVFQSSERGVTFKNARFGLPYQREFGDWEIWFSKSEEGFSLSKRKKRNKGETPQGQTETLGKFHDEAGLKQLLANQDVEGVAGTVALSFGQFKNNPGHVSFHKARFINSGSVYFDSASFSNGGNVSFRDAGFTAGYVSFYMARFINGGHVSFDSAKFSNDGTVNFQAVRFTNGGYVSFIFAHFTNRESVYFNWAHFTNGEGVSFKSAKFEHRESVIFESSKFANGGKVSFSYAEFANKGYVSFGSVWFFNGDHVQFDYAWFNNDGQVQLSGAGFVNGGDVHFDYAKFSNGGSLNFFGMIWANSGIFSWRKVQFIEMMAVKFNECLFLPEGQILFDEAQFPKDGSLMFQRCYFGRTKRIDFTGAFFHHTTFEGGKISWLENQKDRTLAAILKEKLIENFDDLPQETKYRVDQLNMEIPEFSRVFALGVVVLWKDLTTESAKNLTFRLTNLSGSIFDGMTLSHIQLNAPGWAKYDDRTALYEEKEIRDAGGKLSMEELRNIGDQYTQLKNNLEKQGNYPDAGDFHFAEQEIRFEKLNVEREERRKSIQWPDISVLKTEKLRIEKIKGFGKGLWKVFATEGKSYFLSFLTYCYRQLSGYGERPGRAVRMFFLLFFGFSMLVFPFNDGRFFHTLVEMITPFSWKFTLKPDASLKAYQYFLIPGQIILLGIQLPLMILAVRRRFKR